MVRNSPLINLSLLESFKGQKTSDEIDLYIPYLCYALKEIDSELIDKQRVQKYFSDKFDISPPLPALNVILTRARKLGVIERHNHQIFVQFDEVEKITIGYEERKSEIKESIGSLIDEFVQFSTSEFGESISKEEAENYLYEFIQRNIATFARSVTGTHQAENVKIKNRNYLVASFVKFCTNEKGRLRSELSRLVKGCLLANYLSFVDKTTQKNKFNNITVYLDTPIIIGLKGWDGPTRQKSLSEFLNLMIDLKVSVRVFDNTLSETQGVIAFWVRTLRMREYNLLHEKTRQLFKSRGITSEQLNTESVLLEASLNKMGVEIDKNFKLDPAYCCDEAKLEKALRRASFKRPGHDTKCMARVYNSRKGEVIRSFSQKFSIFITPNSKLEDVARRWLNDGEGNTVQVVGSEKWLATVLWLKHPDRFSSLPIDLLVADAYGALNSDDKFWQGFLRRLENLHKSGGVSEEDFNIVRWDNSLFDVVQHSSVTEGDEMDEEDIYDIVDRIKRSHIKEKEEEIRTKDKEIEVMGVTHQKIGRTLKVVSHAVGAFPAILLGWFFSYGVVLFGPGLSALDKLTVDHQLLRLSAQVGFVIVVVAALWTALSAALKIYKITQIRIFTYLRKAYGLDSKLL